MKMRGTDLLEEIDRRRIAALRSKESRSLRRDPQVEWMKNSIARRLITFMAEKEQRNIRRRVMTLTAIMVANSLISVKAYLETMASRRLEHPFPPPRLLRFGKVSKPGSNEELYEPIAYGETRLQSKVDILAMTASNSDLRICGRDPEDVIDSLG